MLRYVAVEFHVHATSTFLKLPSPPSQMSNPGGAEWPLKGTPEMVQFSADDHQSHSDISEVYSLRQTTPDQSEGWSGNEKSYFEEDVKMTICGVSPTTFWILLAVLLALVIGGIIGGVTAAVEINKHQHTARYARTVDLNGNIIFQN